MQPSSCCRPRASVLHPQVIQPGYRQLWCGAQTAIAELPTPQYHKYLHPPQGSAGAKPTCAFSRCLKGTRLVVSAKLAAQTG